MQTTRVHFGRVKYTPGGYCGPRRQRDYQLVIIEVGGAQVTVDDESLTLPAEQAGLFLPGHQEHFVFSAEQATEHVWCSIRPTFLTADLRWRLTRATRMVPCSELMRRLFTAAQGCRRVASLVAGRVVEHLGLALFAEFTAKAAAMRAVPQ